MNVKKKAALFVSIVAVVLMVITAIPTLAFQGVGGSPYASDLLVNGLNTGQLDPGQEYWYAYSRLDLGDLSYNAIILSLNFEANGASIVNRVNFQVFSFDQVDAWLKDNSGPVDSLGLGTPASADFDAGTGERFWSGPVAASDVYYVRIFNLSPSPIQFRLTAVGQNNSNLADFLPLDAGAAAPNGNGIIQASAFMPSAAANQAMSTRPSILASLPVQPTDGSPASTSWLLAAQAIHGLPPQEAAAWLMSAAMLGWLPTGDGAAEPNFAAVPVNPNPQPQTAAEPEGGDSEPEAVAAIPAPPAVLEPDPHSGESIYPNRPVQLLDGPNTGHMAPKTEHWYTFTPGKFDEKLIEDFSLTMFFTPGEPNLARHVTFELFTGSQYHIWERGTPNDMEHFGAGSWVSRDGDYITGERLWHGTIVDGDQYFIKISNETNKFIDYHLVPADIINTELGTPDKGQTLSAKGAIPAALNTAPVEVATGNDIGAPLLLQKGDNAGQLPSLEDRWFSFRTPDTNPGSADFLHYLVELTHRPGYGTIANGVNIEIYPYQEQALWRRGDGDQMKPLGVGGYTEYNKAADSHTWVWDGYLVSNTIYFMRVRNDAPQQIDYDLVIRRR